jgi:hypothetical protein
VAEPGIDERELAGEHRAGDETGHEGPVAAGERDPAQARPGQEEQRRDDRADPRLHHERDIGRGDLDRDLLKAPYRAEERHQAERGRVQRLAVGGHRGALFF